MEGTLNQLDILVDLETRHDDLLRRLDDLDRRVAAVLAEWQPGRPDAPAATSPAGATALQANASE